MKKKLYLAAAFCMIIATGCTNNKKSANSDNVVADTMQVADCTMQKPHSTISENTKEPSRPQTARE